MCTPRLVRWRLRDWASCFLPLDDDDTARPPRVTPRNIMGFDNKRSDINPIYDNKSSRPRKKRNHNTQISDRMDRIQKHNKDRVDDSALSFSADEDYIVFCFREDGAFDVMQDGNKSSDGNPTNHSRPVNRKLNYGEDAEQVWKQRNPNRHKEVRMGMDWKSSATAKVRSPSLNQPQDRRFQLSDMMILMTAAMMFG
ncbi:protein BREAKING OF ASYMMETRY IN THE STOMATAL LINEAGE [Senna tora]|uniref:Protein BREAKING OF ASYMMETRY IN THE STOMATAL LINEAGE n=1 Tax=Senna tora TaxID=362788 RepID=A0A834SL43_9FABA|nr:protein BREAKING OF ASYMMETRY IN THE STOMATAL LINEAGE [Senna tora]